MGRNRVALVGYFQSEEVIVHLGLHFDHPVGCAMVDGIGQQVGQQLRQSTAVTMQPINGADVCLNLALRVNTLDFRDDMGKNVIEVGRVMQCQWNTGPQAPSGKVQYIFNQPCGTSAAGQNVLHQMIGCRVRVFA